MAATLPPNVDVYTVSMDLPFAQLRWRTAEGVSHGVLSSHWSEDLGARTACCCGSGPLQPAASVIDADGRLTHVEDAPDQMAEPNVRRGTSGRALGRHLTTGGPSCRQVLGVGHA